MWDIGNKSKGKQGPTLLVTGLGSKTPESSGKPYRTLQSHPFSKLVRIQMKAGHDTSYFSQTPSPYPSLNLNQTTPGLYRRRGRNQLIRDVEKMKGGGQLTKLVAWKKSKGQEGSVQAP